MSATASLDIEQPTRFVTGLTDSVMNIPQVKGVPEPDVIHNGVKYL